MSTDPREILVKLKATAEAVGFGEFRRQLQDAQRQIDALGKSGAAAGAVRAPTGLQGAVGAAVSQATAAGIDPAVAQQLVNQTLGTSTRAAAKRRAVTPAAASVVIPAVDADEEEDAEKTAQVAARLRARLRSQAFQPSQELANIRAEARFTAQRERQTGIVEGGTVVSTVDRTNPFDDPNSPQRQRQRAQLNAQNQTILNKLRIARDKDEAASRAAEAEPAPEDDDAATPAGGGGGPPSRRRRHGGASGFVQGLLPSTPEQVVRFAAALTGLQLGLDVIAGAARRVHQAIVDAVQAEVLMETTSRSLAATVGGQLAGRFNQASTVLANAPDTRGTQQQFTQSFQAAQSLGQQYGLTTRQIEQVVSASGRLARIHGVDLVQAESAVQSAVQGNTNALDQFGISLTDANGNVRGIGASYQQLVDTSGRVQATQVLLRETLNAVSRQQGQTTSTSTALADALDRLSRAGAESRQALGGVVAGPVAAGANVAADVLSGKVPDLRGAIPRAVAAALPVPFSAAATAVIAGQDIQNNAGDNSGTARQAAMERAAQATEDARTAEQGLIGMTAQETRVMEQQVSVIRSLEINARNAATQLAAMAEQQGRLAQIGAAARGPDFFTGAAGRQAEAQAQAGQEVIAQQAQAAAVTRAADFRRQLVASLAAVEQDTARGGTVGPTAAAARNQLQQQIRELDRRELAGTAEVGAQQAGQLGQRAAADAQARLSTIGFADQQRQLDAAQGIADLRTETLNREGQILSLQHQEANIANELRQAQRENLSLVVQEAQARQAALAPAARLQEVQFNQRRALLQIQATRQDVRLGQADPSALLEIPALRQQLRTAIRQTPRAELNDLLAQRPVQVAEQAATADQLRRTIRVAGIEGRQRPIEDALAAAEALQRVTDERTAAINRQLELAVLAETAERTAAEQAKLAADEVVVAADAAARRSQEWAADIHDGLTDLQRAQDLLSGLGTSGISPTTNTNVNAQIVVNGAGDPAEVARQVLLLLNGASASAPRAVSVTQDLHGH